jgi:hypothetical protein
LQLAILKISFESMVCAPQNKMHVCI